MMRLSAWLNFDKISDRSVILHLGAGRCMELYDYLATVTERIVLVEANPEAVDELVRMTEGHDHVQVVAAAVAAKVEKRPFFVFNYPAVCSLHAASGLQDLFPGLKVKAQPMVETVAVTDFVRQLSLDPSANHLLVIDTPGEELNLVETLLQSNLLQFFAQIVVRTAQRELYDGGADASSIVQSLHSHGYDCLHTDETTDPDFPLFGFALNPQKVQIQVLQDELDRVTREKDGQVKLAMKLQQEIARLNQARGDQAKLADVLQVQFKQLEQAKEAVEQLAAERQEKISQMAHAKDTQDKFSSERQVLIESLTQAKNVAEKQSEELQQQVTELARIKEESSKNAAESAIAIQELTQARDAEAKLAVVRQTQIEQLNKAKEDASKMSEERQKALDLLKTSHNQLEKDLLLAKEQLAVSEEKQIEQSKLAGEYKYKVVQLEEENKSLAQRQQLLDEELIKAEAQIGIIKEIILSGSSSDKIAG